MILLFSLLIVGVLTGYFLKNNEKIKVWVDKLVVITIYFLLFFIGIKVGNNPLIVKNLQKIGFHAFLIALAVVIGSIFTSAIVYKFMFSLQNRKKEI